MAASSSSVQPLTLTASELASLRRLAEAPVFTSTSAAEQAAAAQRAARKAASKARSAQWPNTLEALRARKEEARAAQAAEAEAAGAALDAEIEDERLQERLRVLRAANDYFAGQSDKVKALRNFRQLQDDREATAAGTALKQRRAAQDASTEAAFVASKLQELQAADAQEAFMRQGARAHSKVVAQELTAQVHAAVSAKLKHTAEEYERGRAIAADTAAMEAAELAALVAKRAAAAASTKAFALENVRMAASRASAADADKELSAFVAAQVAAKEAQGAQIKSIMERQRVEGAKKAQMVAELVSSAAEGKPALG